MSKVLLIILITIFSAGFVYLFLEVQSLKNTPVTKHSLYAPFVTNSLPTTDSSNSPEFDYQALIQKEVASAIASFSSQSKATSLPTKTSTTTKQKQTTYIPLSGPFSTNSTDWVDASGTEVYIDAENDYAKDAYITFEATLKIANASGKAYARLFDATHAIAVNGSEVEVTSSSYGTVTSGSLALWRGKNLYKVQIKSLNSEEATFGNGRIKITYQ